MRDAVARRSAFGRDQIVRLGEQGHDALGVAGDRKSAAQLVDLALARRGGLDLVGGVRGKLQSPFQLGRIHRQLAQRRLVGAHLANGGGHGLAQRLVTTERVEHVALPCR